MSELSRLSVAFGAGLLSFFSPCILPLIPAYICFITGLSVEELSESQGQRQRRDNAPIMAKAVLFVLGFSAVFIILGASATFLGSYLIVRQRLFRIIGGALVILFGLHLTGLLNIKFLLLKVAQRLNISLLRGWLYKG